MKNTVSKSILPSILLIFCSCTQSPFQNKSAELNSNPKQPGQSSFKEENLARLEEKAVDAGGVSKNGVISHARQLSFVGSKSGEGYFSVDGKKMIFQSEREPGNPFYQMYLADLATGKVKRLSPGFGKTTCGWVHPNMKKALWSSTHLDGDWKKKAQDEIAERQKPVKGKYSWSFDDQYEIFQSDLNGQNLKQLTHAKGYDAEASYSNDGQWIAFASNRSAYEEKMTDEQAKLFKQDPSSMMEIYIMKSDGTQVRRLTNALGYDGGPFFSADSKKITWRRFAPNGATAEIYTMNIDGSEQKAVTHLGVMSWAPFFHPSGDYIVFTSSLLGFSNFELFVVDAEGKHKPVRVSFEEGFDGLPSFSPDGKQITWTHRNEKGESQIMIADWDDELVRYKLGISGKKLSQYEWSKGITEKDAKRILYHLSSPIFEGRPTAGEFEKSNFEDLATIFRRWGFKPGLGSSFLHSFEFVSGVKLGLNNNLELKGRTSKLFQVEKDFMPLSISRTGLQAESPLIFAGYGIRAPASEGQSQYDSYRSTQAEVSWQGKWIIVLDDLPQDLTPERRHFLSVYSRLNHKITIAKNLGAAGVLVVPSYDSKEDFKLKYDGSLGDNSIFVLRVSRNFLDLLLKQQNLQLTSIQSKLDKGESLDPISFESTYLKAQVELNFERKKAYNFIAELKAANTSSGSIMVGAHGDHLGKGQQGNSLAKPQEWGQFHPGADDNASGVTAAILIGKQLAEAKQKGLQLKNNIYISIWSGEELGNLGSSHFLKDRKPQLKAYVNMDMIGRFKNKVLIQGVGSAENWNPFIEEMALRTGLSVGTQEDPYQPTDSMSFYNAKIPSVTFFTGGHSEYHTPRDVPSLIEYGGLIRITQGIYDLVTSLALTPNLDLKYKSVASEGKQLEGRSFRVYLGTIPDYTQEGVSGVKISGASKGSPAEAAGLKEGDILIEFNSTKIENIYDYVYTLQSVKPNVETSIKVKRDGKTIDLKITPALKN